ncbi:YggT family protein [Massilia violaceinigra]|uniref:YggT family protein n=2 Tax=Massilia TaxID=149698 RepID=A0ABY4AEL9_9BURK|nr:YggT family protein [Massilia aquatica]NHZ38793.1 YggT family protein [Massilia aquatica]UOD33257.1 YggT family protein [Massilia violaceinigra]
MIVDTIASILGGVLLLRFWMQAIRVRPPPQIGQFIFTLTDWMVLPMRRVIPGVGGYDWASLVGAFLVVALASAIVYFGAPYELVALMSLYTFLTWILYGFMGTLLVEVILSWVNPQAPMAPFIQALNEPLLRPLRKVVPPIGGIDLSVMVALILIKIVHLLVQMMFGLR